MNELRRSFKSTKSLSEDSGDSFQISNFVTSPRGAGIPSYNSNNEYSLNSDFEYRTPLLNRLNNQSATNSESSNSTIGSSIGGGSTVLSSNQKSNYKSINEDKLNYSELYYMSPSKRKRKDNLHYMSEEKQTLRKSFKKQSSETNSLTLKDPFIPKVVQQLPFHDSVIGSWSTDTIANNINKNIKDNSAVNNITISNSCNNRRSRCHPSSEGVNSNATTNSITASSLGCIGRKILTGTSNSTQVDQNLDNFDICSHYSDSVAVITKNHPSAPMQFLKSGSGIVSGGSGSRSNNVTFSNCTEERYMNRHRSPSFSSTAQFQHQKPQQNDHNILTTDILLTRPTTPHSNRGSLRRSKGRSNQSLCSCDAGDSTEIQPDPNRPLFQYSLDRKKKKHTYTCEQNAQILMRLEREKNLRNNSCGNLAGVTGIGKSSSRKSLDKQSDSSATDIDIPPPPPPPSGRKLSFKPLQDNLIDDCNAIQRAPTSTTAAAATTVTANDEFQSQIMENLNPNYQPYQHNSTATNTVSFNISNNNSSNNKCNNINNNNNYNSNNNYSNNSNCNNINNNTSNIVNNNNTSGNNNFLKSTSNTIVGNLGCKIGEQMLNDCTSTILNCANIRQQHGVASSNPIQQSTLSRKTPTTTGGGGNLNKPDVCQMGNNSRSNLLNTTNKLDSIKQENDHQIQLKTELLLPDNNGNVKRLNQENIPLTPYPYIRDDSYLPCFKSATSNSAVATTAEESIFLYHQELPQYTPNFDNRPSLQNNFGSRSTGKYNTIGPSNCYAKYLANHHHPNDFCNFSHLKPHHQTNGKFNGGVGGGGFVTNSREAICNGGTNLINGKYFSQSLTNFAFTSNGAIDANADGGRSHRSFGMRTTGDDHGHGHSHNCHDLGATILPYTQFRTPAGIHLNNAGCARNTSFGNSTSTINGGINCSFDNSLISCSFTTIGSGNSSGVKGLNGVAGKDQIHQHLTCSTLKGSSTALSGGSGSSLMPWKHRQCPSRGSSSSGTNSLRFDFAKHWFAVSSLLLLIGAASVAVPLALRVAASAPFEQRLQIATQILETVPLIDGHNDLPWNIRKFLHNKLNDFNFDEDLRNVTPWAKSQWSHTDLQRLRSGRVSAQFWAAYVPCEAQHRDAVQLTLEQIDVIKRLTERYSVLTTCTSSSDIIEAHKDHKLCSLTGVEGGHSLGGSLAVLRTLYAIGVRYMTLTSTCHTPWADSSYADAPTFNVKHGGLTSFGKTIIREMNRLGMIVDLSHVSTGTMRDALSTSEAPVIFSHSSAYELCNSSRNVKDDILLSLAKNGGIVMVNFYSKFLSCNENSTVHDAVAHINHIRRIAGIDHVGLGAGFDGINFTPKGLEDVSTYPTLFAELLGEGWSIEDLKKLAGENFLRVMREVEKIRDEKKKAGVRPYEDHPNFRTEDPYNCTSS